jgi:hypothetical protein
VRVSGDEIRYLLHIKQLPGDDAMYIGHLVCKRLKREGYNVAHDADFARPIVRQLLEEANDGKIKTIWIRIAPPEAFVINKLRNYERLHPGDNWLFPNGEAAVDLYFKRKALHVALPELENLSYLYVFDTSRDDLDAQVDEFVQKARQMLA